MAQRIRLTESELNEIVAQVLKEEMEETFMDRLKSGYNSFMGKGAKEKNGALNLSGRWNAAKTGYNEQGNIDKNNECWNYISALMKRYNLTMQSSIKDLYNATRSVNMRAGVNRTEAQNNIYNKGARDWNAKVARLQNGTGGYSQGLNSASSVRGDAGYGAVQP